VNASDVRLTAFSMSAISDNGTMITKYINPTVPLVGLAILLYYSTCETSCASLRGSLLGIDLKLIGMAYMVTLFLLGVWELFSLRLDAPVLVILTVLLSGAIGGEVYLVRFQVMNETYCVYCLLYGFCIATMYALNFPRMNLPLSITSVLAGLTLFGLGLQASVLPMYDV